MNSGKLLRDLRELQELSQEQLAVKCGLASNTLRRMEGEYLTFTQLRNIMKVAKGLGCKLTVYLGEDRLV